MSVKKTLLLDAYALIFRGYYAFIKIPYQFQRHEHSAIMGFMNSLLDVIKREKPTTWLFALTKEALRKGQRWRPNTRPTETKPQKLLLLQYPTFKKYSSNAYTGGEKEGFEADDIIGTLANKLKKDYQTFMVTPDKDFAQLVSETFLSIAPHVWEMGSKFGEYPKKKI